MEDFKDIQLLIEKYPNRVPVIIYQTPRFKRLYKLKKHKYLVGSENTVGFFIFQLKKINDIHTTDAIYLLHNTTVLNSMNTFGFLKIQYRTDCLMLTIDTEGAFG